MRVKRTIVSVIVIVAFLAAVCTVRPTPAYASSSSATTIAIILGGTIGGLALLAIIFTLIVRNNPAWMPAAPVGRPDLLKATPWEPPAGRVRFGPGCGVRDGALPLVCW
jgi:hypothetical protein